MARSRRVGDDDLVHLYLSDVGRRALLTKDDEARLAKLIEAGPMRAASLRIGVGGVRGVGVPCVGRCGPGTMRAGRSWRRTCAWSFRSPGNTRRRVSRWTIWSRTATSD